ncbi:succinate dehydrogenase [Dipodascopsis tothii]|uniref:succinate dehydrogenase n=1 Tax=Dipodascopsis tothii TaxID=44089 RepID=UPI0034CDC5D2
MIPTLVRLARPARNAPTVNLLPPLPLYRRILRAHRKLPLEHRFLGDQYVKAEFRLHKDVDNPVYIVGFLSSWQQYVEQIEGDKWRDGKLDVLKLEKMSDEQLIQLYELMQSTQGRPSEYNVFADEKEPKE